MKRVLLLALALTTAACGGGGGDASTSPTAPSGPSTTDTFSGTVAVGGNDWHPFAVTLTGGVDVTLTAAGPPPSIWMGIGVGAPNGSVCQVLTSASAVLPASTTPQLSGTLAPGTYCVVVYDVGNQTTDVAYNVTVKHF